MNRLRVIQHHADRLAAGAFAVALAVPILVSAAPSMAAGSGGAITGSGAISLTSVPGGGTGSCAAAATVAEARHGLPAGMLAAIGAVESGRFDPVLQANLAWPWTINAEGEGATFDGKTAAIAEVTALRAQGVESIDVGCMQVNLRWHPDAFTSLDDAFDPAINTDYAARLLNRLLAEHGDWATAIGYYHSPTDWRQADYQAKVADAWTRLGGGLSDLPAAVEPAEPALAPSGPVLFGGLVAAGGPTAGIAAPAAPGQASVHAGGPSDGLVQAARALTDPTAASGGDTLRFFPLPSR